jgi:phospholipase/carboxylesterase
MSAGPADEWPHLFTPGSGPVLLMLHGTGGSEKQIAPLGSMLDAEAAILAPRGRVSENGMLRWFRRHAEGVFDTDSVIAEAAALARFVEWGRVAYNLAGRPIIAVGMSNGANIALATALLHPDTLNKVVAFSGMHPLPETPLTRNLTQVDVLLLNGADDPMAPAASVDQLERELRATGARVERRARPGGHGIDRSEIAAAQRWIGLRAKGDES